MNKFFKLATTLVCFSIGSSAVLAEPVELQVSGIIVESPEGTFEVNTPWTMTVKYDTDNILHGTKYFPVMLEYHIDGYTATNSQAGINVERFSDMDSYQIVDEGNPWSGTIAGRQVTGFGVNFQGHDANELDDFDFSKPYALNLNDWEVKNGGPALDGTETISSEVLSFELSAKTPLQLTEELSQAIIELYLPANIETSLTTKLDIVIEKLSDSNDANDVSASNNLFAFINKINALKGKHISEEDAEFLVVAANDLIVQLQQP